MSIFLALSLNTPVCVLCAGITDLGNIQFPLSTQAVPAFLIGLFLTKSQFDIHPWSIVAGAMCSTVYVFAFYFGYLNAADDPRPINSGIAGLVLNVAVVVSTELLRRTLKTNLREGQSTDHDAGVYALVLFPGRPQWDMPDLTRFGEHALSPEFIWNAMEGVNEPMTNMWWTVLFFLTITIVTPLTPENDPPMVDGSFLYSPQVLAGMPWWFLKILMFSAISTIVLLVAIYNIPHDYPEVAADVEAKVHEVHYDHHNHKHMDQHENKQIDRTVTKKIEVEDEDVASSEEA